MKSYIKLVLIALLSLPLAGGTLLAMFQLRYCGDNNFNWIKVSEIPVFSRIDRTLFSSGNELTGSARYANNEQKYSVLVFDFNPQNFLPNDLISLASNIDFMLYNDYPDISYGVFTDMSRTRIASSRFVEAMFSANSSNEQYRFFSSANNRGELELYYKVLLTHFLISNSRFHRKMKISVYVNSLTNVVEFSRDLSTYFSKMTGVEIIIEFKEFR